MKPRILFITRKLPPRTGGMEKHAASILAGFEKLGLSVDLIGLNKKQSNLAWWLSYALAQGLVRAQNADVIVTQDALLAPLGAILKRATGKPWVCIAHGLDVIWPMWAYQRTVRMMLPCADRVICVSGATKDECVSRGVDAERISVIPNGIDPRDDFSMGGRNVLFVGRLVKRKGAEWLAECVAPLLPPDVRVQIVGSGPRLEALKEIVRKRPNVEALGYVSDEGLNALYQNAGVFVMPNIRVDGDMEGFGIAALEAQARGIPVAATSVDGIPDAVTHGVSGLLTPEGDAQAFAKSIVTLMNWDREKRLAIKARADKQFNWLAVSQQYSDVIADCARPSV